MRKYSFISYEVGQFIKLKKFYFKFCTLKHYIANTFSK